MDRGASRATARGVSELDTIERLKAKYVCLFHHRLYHHRLGLCLEQRTVNVVLNE